MSVYHTVSEIIVTMADIGCIFNRLCDMQWKE